MITVSMDVHVRNSFVHASDGAGHLLAKGRCSNSLLELGAFLAPIEKAARNHAKPVRIVLESTTNSRGMSRMLGAYAREAGMDTTVDVLDSRRLRVIAESVCKTDAIDAGILHELACSNLKLPVCYMPDDEEFALREHLRARSDMVRMRTMLKNRLHAVMHRRAILTPQGDLFTRNGRKFLEQVDLDQAGREIVNRFLHAVDHLDQAVNDSTKDLRNLARSARWAKPVALLTTTPGIGLITALTILAELGNIKRFSSRAAVANYAGLIPIIRNSNEKHFAGGISRRGSRHLRAVLVEAAWMAVPRVPAYHDLFSRVSLRKGKPTAIIAVARRMLEDSYTMLKKDQAFRYQAVPITEAKKNDWLCAGMATQRSSKAASSVAG